MKKSLILCIGIATISLSACAPALVSLTAPELMQPVSIKADTALVTRGNVERVEQYRAFIRIRSEGLFFPDTGLRFGEYFVMAGDRVVEGQLLARLDTKRMEERIAEQDERLDRMRLEHAFETDMLALDIDIARAEYVNIMRTADFNEQTMEAADRKKMEIQRLELSLAQTLERQALTMKHAEVNVNEMKARLPDAEMRAPYDGIITLRLPRFPGDHVEPFSNLIYISDESERIVEYGSDESITVGRGQILRAYDGDVVYELERIAISRSETFFFTSRQRAIPLRMIPIDPNVELPPPGTFLPLRVFSGIAEDVLRIPANALFSDPEIGRYVYRMEGGNKIPVEIEVGLMTDTFVEVTYGLNEGDEVYVKP
jgi:multidrug efflux pump subunit AcrA (membrane-fusion protein)